MTLAATAACQQVIEWLHTGAFVLEIPGTPSTPRRQGAPGTKPPRRKLIERREHKRHRELSDRSSDASSTVGEFPSRTSRKKQGRRTITRSNVFSLVSVSQQAVRFPHVSTESSSQNKLKGLVEKLTKSYSSSREKNQTTNPVSALV